MAFSLKMVLAFFLHLMEQIWRLFRSITHKADLVTTDTALKDKIQINVKLCKRLEKKLVKTRKLTGLYGKHCQMSDMQKKVLHELDLVMKRAEDLLQQCMCKGTKSWLYYAVTLTDIKEDVLEIELDLTWWTSILGMSTTYHLDSTLDFEEDNDVIKALEHLKTCYYKLSDERESLQMKAAKDNERLQSKLEEERMKHAEGTEQYFLIVYLLSRLKDSKGVFDTPDDDIKFLDEHFHNNLKSTKILGRGSFGEVHAVAWLRQYLKFRKWAMKIIFLADERRPEGKFLQFCNHPHIIRFIWSWKQEHSGNSNKDEKVEEGEKFPHILMEFMPTDLSTLIAQRVKKNGGPPFEEHVAIDMMLQIAKAVRYLHGKKINIDGTKSKITHRDLKPKNVLVEPCGTRWNVKLTDFGISKVYHGTETKTLLTAKQGTVIYAAPEVWLLEDDSSKSRFPPKADVWSFAMICSEILTGDPPFTGYQLPGLHVKIKEQGIRPNLPSNLPDYVRFCIMSCWNLNPQQRPNFLNICRMLSLAKAMSLGILPLDFRTRPLLRLENPMWQIPHTGVSMNIASSDEVGEMCADEFEDSALGHEIGEKYFLVGTRFKNYVNKSMKEEILDQNTISETGIQATQDRYKSLNLIYKPIMQGSLWAHPQKYYAYGCLTGVFVSSKYEAELMQMNVEFVMGGFIAETDTASEEPHEYKCLWGDMTADKKMKGLLAAQLYCMGEFEERYAYIYVRYGLTNRAIITHLWHDDELVLGDRTTASSAFIKRKQLGSKILTDFSKANDHHNYSLTEEEFLEPQGQCK